MRVFNTQPAAPRRALIVTPTGYTPPRQVRRARGSRLFLPLWHLAILVAAVILVKAALFFEMGGGAYTAKAETLRQGTALERAAGHLMTLDPLSRTLIDTIRFRLL